MKVRIGVGLGVAEMVSSASEFARAVDATEQLGFDSLWMSEVAASPALDPVAALGFAAGRTSRLKLGTSIMVLSGRSPALVAQSVATLDRLTDSRFLPIFGLGTVHPDEQQAFGISRQERGAWVEEALPLLRRFWTEDHVTHEGAHFRYHDLSIQPRPTRPVPIWLGGRASSELRPRSWSVSHPEVVHPGAAVPPVAVQPVS